MKFKFVSAAAVAAALIASSLTSAIAAPPIGSPSTDAKADYIVVFKDGANVGSEKAALASSKISVLDEYSAVFKGVLVSMTAGQKAAFERRPNVQSVSLDTPVKSVGTVKKQDVTTLWNLDRIDQASASLDNSFSYTNSGSGVKAYVVDTGINTTHTEFTGRISGGYSVLQGGKIADCNGHGTHVASTLGGTTYGAAKSVTIVPVRVLDCSGSGTASGVVKGLDWVYKQISASNPSTNMVANMSLGGAINTAIDSAVSKLTVAGVTVVVAAGNETKDACTTSPARVAGAITVAASNKSDNLAWFSNFGSCVDIVAPGVEILGAWTGTKSATNTISGTSMASPLVAGTVAAAISAGKSASDVITNANSTALKNLPLGTPNALLFFSY